MRNFFGYATDGQLHWQIVRTGGFPPECNLSDPNCTHPLSIAIRNQIAKTQNNATFGEIVEFTCACTCECGCVNGVCQCAVCDCAYNKQKSSFYCETTGGLVDKPAVVTTINSAPIADQSTTVLAPSSLFTVKLTSAGIPDGETVTLSVDKLHADATVTLTFTDGATNEVTFRAPAQGVTGGFSMISKYVTQFSAAVKGFE